MKIAIVLSPYYKTIVNGLLHGVKEVLLENEIKASQVQTFHAPGAFEIPLITQEIARTGKFDGVIALGCVIKGETFHFEAIALSSAIGVMQAGLSTRVPIAFGILTVQNEKQALARSRKDTHNKGREAANACLGSISTLRAARSLRKRS